MSRTFKDAPSRVRLARLAHKHEVHWYGCEHSVSGGAVRDASTFEMDAAPHWLTGLLFRVECCWNDVWASAAARQEHYWREHRVNAPEVNPSGTFVSPSRDPFGRRLWFTAREERVAHECEMGSGRCRWEADNAADMIWPDSGRGTSIDHGRAAVRDGLVGTVKEFRGDPGSPVEDWSDPKPTIRRIRAGVSSSPPHTYWI